MQLTSIRGLLLCLYLWSGDLAPSCFPSPQGHTLPLSAPLLPGNWFTVVSYLLSAPEMVKGDPIGSATDIWGAGVLTYIM